MFISFLLDRKRALEDVAQRPGHVSEFNKQKHLEAVDKGQSPAQKPKTSSGSKSSVKSISSTKNDSNLGEYSTRYKSKNLEDGTLPECKQVSDKAVSLQRKVSSSLICYYRCMHTFAIITKRTSKFFIFIFPKVRNNDLLNSVGMKYFIGFFSE